MGVQKTHWYQACLDEMKTEIRKDEDTVGSRCKLGALSKGHEGARGSTGGAPGEEKCFLLGMLWWGVGEVDW